VNSGVSDIFVPDKMPFVIWYLTQLNFNWCYLQSTRLTDALTV